MKKISLILMCMILGITNLCAQTELNEEQIQLRTQIKNAIAADGYDPSIDSDGDIAFKHEGTNYYVRVYPGNEPYMICLFRAKLFNDTYTKDKVMAAVGKCNLKKGVKLVCSSQTFTYRAEMFISSATEFKKTYKKLINQIKHLSNELDEMM